MKYDDFGHYSDNGNICVKCDLEHGEDTGPCACGAEGIWTFEPFEEAMFGSLSYSFMCESCEAESNASV